MKYIFSVIALFLLLVPMYAQDKLNTVNQDSIRDQEIFDIAVKPTKSAFYSAILPGLGQAYNKDYWKIPVVYAALGTGIYAYKFNNDNYHKYRNAYKLLKLDLENDYPGVSASALESAQEYHKKYRDLSLLVTAGLYVLQIVEASVDAHLQYHNTEPDLSYKPVIFQEPLNNNVSFGVSVSYKF